MRNRLPLLPRLALPWLVSSPIAASYVQLPAQIGFLDVPKGGEIQTERYTRDQLEQLAQHLRPALGGTMDDQERMAYYQITAAIRAGDFRSGFAMPLPPETSTCGAMSISNGAIPNLTTSASAAPATPVLPVTRNAAATTPSLRKEPKAGWIAGPVSLWGGDRFEGLKAMRVVQPTKDCVIKGDAFALLCAAQGQIFRLTLDGIRTDLVKTVQGRLPWLPRTWGMDEPADLIQLPDGTIECLTSMGRYYRIELDGTATLLDDVPLYGYATLEQGPKGERLLMGSSGILRLDPALAGMTRTQLAGGTWAAKSWDGLSQPQPALGASLQLRSFQAVQDGSMLLLSAGPRGDTPIVQMSDSHGSWRLNPIDLAVHREGSAHALGATPLGEWVSIHRDPENGESWLQTPDGAFRLPGHGGAPLIPLQAGFPRRLHAVSGGFLAQVDDAVLFFEDPRGEADAVNRSYEEGLRAISMGDEIRFKAILAELSRPVDEAQEILARLESKDSSAGDDPFLLKDLLRIVSQYAVDSSRAWRQAMAVDQLKLQHARLLMRTRR